MNQICIESDFQYTLSKQICIQMLKVPSLGKTNNILTYLYFHIMFEST